MAFWADPSNVFLKQSHRWVISFPEIYSGDSGKDSIKQYFKATAFAKSVDRPTMSMKTVQAKYLYAHTFNFPTRYVWNPIKITFYDILLKNEKVKPVPTQTPGPTDNIFVYYKNPVISNDLKYVIAGEGGLQNYNYYLQSTQYFFQTLLQTSGYTVPNEFDAVDKLIRFRDYNFKDSLASHFSGHVKKDGRYENNYIIIKEIDELGKIIEEWRLYNPIITEVTPSKLDYSSDEALTITIGVTYDWAEFHPTMLVDDELKKKAEEEAKKAEEEQEKKRAKEEAKKEAEERDKKQAEKEAEERKKKRNTLDSINLEIGTIGRYKDAARSICEVAIVKMIYYDEDGLTASKTVNDFPDNVIREITGWISLVSDQNGKKRIQDVIDQLKRCAEAATPPAAVPAPAATTPSTAPTAVPAAAEPSDEESGEESGDDEESGEESGDDEESGEESEERLNRIFVSAFSKCEVRVIIKDFVNTEVENQVYNASAAITHIESQTASPASKVDAIQFIRNYFSECLDEKTPETKSSPAPTAVPAPTSPTASEEEPSNTILRLDNVKCQTTDGNPCTGADIVFIFTKIVNGKPGEQTTEEIGGDDAGELLSIINNNKDKYKITTYAKTSISVIESKLKECLDKNPKPEALSAAPPADTKPADTAPDADRATKEEGAPGSGSTYSFEKRGEYFTILVTGRKGVKELHREFSECVEAVEYYEELKVTYPGATFGQALKCEEQDGEVSESDKKESTPEASKTETTKPQKTATIRVILANKRAKDGQCLYNLVVTKSDLTGETYNNGITAEIAGHNSNTHKESLEGDGYVVIIGDIPVCPDITAEEAKTIPPATTPTDAGDKKQEEEEKPKNLLDQLFKGITGLFPAKKEEKTPEPRASATAFTADQIRAIDPDSESEPTDGPRLRDFETGDGDESEETDNDEEFNRRDQEDERRREQRRKTNKLTTEVGGQPITTDAAPVTRMSDKKRYLISPEEDTLDYVGGGGGDVGAETSEAAAKPKINSSVIPDEILLAYVDVEDPEVSEETREKSRRLIEDYKSGKYGVVDTPAIERPNNNKIDLAITTEQILALPDDTAQEEEEEYNESRTTSMQASERARAAEDARREYNLKLDYLRDKERRFSENLASLQSTGTDTAAIRHTTFALEDVRRSISKLESNDPTAQSSSNFEQIFRPTIDAPESDNYLFKKKSSTVIDFDALLESNEEEIQKELERDRIEDEIAVETERLEILLLDEIKYKESLRNVESLLEDETLPNVIDEYNRTITVYRIYLHDLRLDIMSLEQKIRQLRSKFLKTYRN